MSRNVNQHEGVIIILLHPQPPANIAPRTTSEHYKLHPGV